jgi:Kef-type K+ transport system membrane component KefB
VVAAATVAPLLVDLLPIPKVPPIVTELVAGIIIGPVALDVVDITAPLQVFSQIGLVFLFFLAGLEIAFDARDDRHLGTVGAAFVVSLALALAVALIFEAVELIGATLLVAIILGATSFGIVVAVLKDAGQTGTPFGQLVIAGASLADFATVILLSLFFSREAGSTASKVILLGGLFVVAVLVAMVVAGVERSMRLGEVLRRLQDTTAQIRIRAAFVLLVGLVALATELGLEVILGAFIAGAIISLVDRDRAMTHPDFRRKLEAAGFGIFVPVFFVTTGIRYDLDALTASTSTLLHVPIFLAALVAVRGLPALLYRPVIPRERVPIAVLMQATSLPFIVAATAVGLALHVVSPANAAALIAAGLLSVVIFPAVSLVLLRRGQRERASATTTPTASHPATT